MSRALSYRSSISGASDSKSKSYGVTSCKIVSGRGKCKVDLKVAPERLRGTLTVTPRFAKVGGKTAIRSWSTKFQIKTTCSGGSCGPPSVLDVTGSVWYRWDVNLDSYGETKRNLRQERRPTT
jgi:hypothetical protein